MAWLDLRETISPEGDRVGCPRSSRPNSHNPCPGSCPTPSPTSKHYQSTSTTSQGKEGNKEKTKIHTGEGVVMSPGGGVDRWDLMERCTQCCTPRPLPPIALRQPCVQYQPLSLGSKSAAVRGCQGEILAEKRRIQPGTHLHREGTSCSVI